VLHDWIYWLSLRHPDQLLALLGALFLIDGPRYGLSKLVLCLYDSCRDLWRALRDRRPEAAFAYCPSVCVVIAAYNEAEHIEASLESVWGSYPRLEIVVIDDGSTDDMFEAAQRFARDHAGVRVLRMPERSGKSPALNLALRYTKAEVVVGLDGDSLLGPAAIWEIVQPLADPRVGLVSGAVLGRNPLTNLVTWLQAYEFLHTVFAGRILMARLGILGVASGAFSAFRRSALDEGYGWDEGSSADLDVTLRIRKSGHQVVFAPYAECYTDMMSSWMALIKQRLRWDRSIFRNYARKHVDMAYVTSRNFRWADFSCLLENWFFSYFCMYGIVAWAVWFCCYLPSDWWQILVGLYLCYQVFELVQILAMLYYTNSLRRDLLICAVFPLVVFYQILLLIVRLVGTTEEIFLRRSYTERFTPDRVRNATWHW
jgi:cellulose synthase/poly-beta-1,6-N-acetylglucosamine synthase-like glycosyltransferase